MEKVFKLKENGTSVRTEILAGFTTFVTMAYIIALNPNLLTNFAIGTPLWNAVFMATCIASAVGTIAMAFLANKPFVMAPSMGLNSFFAVVCANIITLAGLNGVEMSYTEAFQAGLCIILAEGIVFFLLSLFRIRDKIVNAIPKGIRTGIGPAIGLMLMNIGFGSNVSMYTESGGPYYVLRDFFGALTPKVIADAMGGDYRRMLLNVITMFIGFFVIVLLAKKGRKGGVLIGILIGSIINWAGQLLFLNTNPFASLASASFVPPVLDMLDTTFFKFNFKGFLQIGVFSAVTLILTFCMIDMFDTIGTLVGTASRSGMVDENGDMPQMKEALLADAIGTMAGAVTGTSTVTTFVESAAGVEEGGRTGLTSLTAGLLFLLCMFISPIVAIIPSAATSSALIYVGILMLLGLKNLNFDDLDETVPAFLMLISFPISGSIGHGIGIAIISYTVIKLFSGKGKEVSVLTYVISVLFLIKFFLVTA